MMNERERIFELVKKNIITSEEALVLLEKLATEKDEAAITKGTVIDIPQSKEDSIEDEAFFTFDEATFEAEMDALNQEELDQKRLEKILDELVSETNTTSVKLDNINLEITQLDEAIKETNEQIIVINTLEELESLSEEKISERISLTATLADLEQQKAAKQLLKADLEAQLKVLKQEQKQNTKEQWEQQVDDISRKLSEAGEVLGEAGDKFGRKLGEKGMKLGQMLKSTFENVSTAVNENVEWKDINIKVPGMVSSSFSHEFVYPETSATLIDIKLANGEVALKSWDSEDIKIEADIKLYGKMEAATPFEAFLERSEISVTEEKIVFHVPNKRIKTDIVFYLPKRVYDHIAVNMLNGDISFKEIEANDAFVKSTNGDMSFNLFYATMLEVKSVNGDVKVTDSKVLDFIGESVNGDYTLKSEIDSIGVSGVNGDVKITGQSQDMKKIAIKLVSGTIKVALPETIGCEGSAKTNTGSINNRLTNIEIIEEKKETASHLFKFRRIQKENVVDVNLNTTSGSIYLKDTTN